MSDTPDRLARYHRQMLLPGIGERGQRRLGEMRGLLVGCGALGTVIADTLSRAGIGALTIVDRDVVEITNLQRQVLFDEDDVARATPKAEAARAKLARINRDVQVRAVVDDFNAGNAESLTEDADLILDGLDNFETRYLLNDLAVKFGLPYVYGGAVGTTGMAMTVLPRRPAAARARRRIDWPDEMATPCLRCVFPDPPPPGSAATCDTAGVLGPVVTIIAAHQAAQAIKLLTGNIDAIDRSMLSIELWSNEIRRFETAGMTSDACPCCGAGRFEYLDAGATSAAVALCGRGAVQINPAARDGPATIDLDALARRLAAHGRFEQTGHLLRGELSGEAAGNGRPIEIMLFPTGRAIIKGTDDPTRARAIYSRYIGD